MGVHLVPAPPEPLLSGAANLAALPAAASNRNVIAKTTDGGVYISDGSAWQQISPPTGTYASLAGGNTIAGGNALSGALQARGLAFAAGLSPGSGNLWLGGQRVTVLDDSAHNAFPGLAAKKGVLYGVYRAAPSHDAAVGANRGIINLKTSTDLGQTWTAAVAIIDDGNLDCRDPNITALASGRLIISFFKHDGVNQVGVYTTYSDDNAVTWSAPVLAPNYFDTDNATSGRIIELANGDLLLPGYGFNAADTTHESSIVHRSINKGVSWGAAVVIANGVTDTKAYDETTVTQLANGHIVALIRQGPNTNIYRSVSTDNGATWGAAASVIASASGRPAAIALTSGALVCFHRGTTVQSGAVYRTSWDEGVTWTAQKVVQTAGVKMTYGSMQEVAPGVVGVLYSMEETNNNADLYFRYLLDGPSTTPLGDRYTGGIDGRFGDKSDGSGLIQADQLSGADKNYEDLWVGSGHTFTVERGTIIYCDHLILDGAIAGQNNVGANAAGATGGAKGAAPALRAGSMFQAGNSGSSDGVTGGTGAGSQATAVTGHTGLGGSGGAGGAGGSASGGGAAGGGAGSGAVMTAGTTNPRSLASVFAFLCASTVFNGLGGRGGSSGAGDGTNVGGGGGGGGSVGTPVVILARIISGAGTIAARGGNGGNGANGAGGNAGGGGGGGGGSGGQVWLFYQHDLSTIVVSAPGGTHGTHGNGVGTGANGSDGGDGGAGVAVKLQVR